VPVITLARVPSRTSYSEGLGFNALNFVLVAALGLGTSIVTAHIFGARVLGEYAIVLATSGLVMVLSTARERPAFVREVAGREPRDLRLSALFIAMLSFSAALTTVVALLLCPVVYLLLDGPVGHPELFAPAIVAIACYVLFDNTIAQVETVFTVFRAGRLLFRVRLAQAALLATLSIAFGLARPDVWSLVAATGIASAVVLAARLWSLRAYVRARVPRDELRAGFRTLPDIIRFGLKIAPGAMADGVSNQAAPWILGSLVPLATVGAYNRAWQLARSVLLFNNRVTEMLFPTLIERHRAGDHAGFDRVLVDTLRYSAAGLLMLGAAVGGAASGVIAIYGPGFERGADVLPWVLCVPGLLTLAMVQRYALYVFDRPLLTTASALLRMGVTLAATLPLTRALGIEGAGIALCLGLVVDIAFTTSRVVPRLQQPLWALWPARQLLGLVAAFAAGFAVARAIDDPLPGLAGGAAGSLAGAVVYFAVLVVVGGMTQQDLERVRRLRRLAGRGRPTLAA
jgi:O-antigen/teichoic acid export membrane protein